VQRINRGGMVFSSFFLVHYLSSLEKQIESSLLSLHEHIGVHPPTQFSVKVRGFRRRRHHARTLSLLFFPFSLLFFSFFLFLNKKKTIKDCDELGLENKNNYLLFNGNWFGCDESGSVVNRLWLEVTVWILCEVDCWPYGFEVKGFCGVWCYGFDL